MTCVNSIHRYHGCKIARMAAMLQDVQQLMFEVLPLRKQTQASVAFTLLCWRLASIYMMMPNLFCVDVQP